VGLWRRLILTLATFGGVGYLPGMPGTWGSLAALPLWWVMQRYLSPQGYALAFLALLIVSLWAGGQAWNLLGETDHPAIVLDEVMGLLVALAWVPPKWPWVALGFALFRAFDILKPFPLKYLEQLPGGFGVVMDDVAAGAAARAVLGVIMMLVGGRG
jgi:phosphatidylglycerophosphatase A